MLHFLRLAHGLAELIAPQTSKQGQVRLDHEPQLVAGRINLLLHRTLGHAQEVHAGDFREQDVVMKPPGCPPRMTASCSKPIVFAPRKRISRPFSRIRPRTPSWSSITNERMPKARL